MQQWAVLISTMSGKGKVNFTGKWELTATENYSEWLVAMSIPEPDRKKYLTNTPSLEIVHEGDTFNYVSRKGEDVKKVSKQIGVEYLDTAHGMNEIRVSAVDCYTQEENDWGGCQECTKITAHYNQLGEHKLIFRGLQIMYESKVTSHCFC